MGSLCGTEEQKITAGIEREIDLHSKEASKTHKLLLLGPGNSGKSTFFKQLCKIHSDGFQNADIDMAQQNIYDCVIDQMIQLIEICYFNIKNQNKILNKKKYNNKYNNNNILSSNNHNNYNSDDDDDDQAINLLHDTNNNINGINNVSNNNGNNNLINNRSDFVYKLEGEAKKCAEYLTSNNLPRGGIEINTNIAKMIDTLWNDESIKQTFYNRTNLGVVDSAPHFFNDIMRIGAMDFKPTNEDILLVRMPTTGIREASFSLDNNKFTLIDVGGQRNERNKWIHHFDTVSAVLFVASLSCYDQMLFEVDKVNAMHESIKLFDVVVNNRYFKRTTIIIFFNKYDLFCKKLPKKPLTTCFENYNGPLNDINSAKEYIKQVFLSCNTTNIKDKIYTHFTTATNADNVIKVFNDVQHSVVMTALNRTGVL